MMPQIWPQIPHFNAEFKSKDVTENSKFLLASVILAVQK